MCNIGLIKNTSLTLVVRKKKEKKVHAASQKLSLGKNKEQTMKFLDSCRKTRPGIELK